MAAISKEEYIRRHGIDEWKRYNASKGSSIEKMIKKYGIDEGTKRYNDANAKRAGTLENYIAKYGIDEGTKRHNSRIENDKIKGTLTGYISRYGKDAGTEKYNEKNSRLSVGKESLAKRGFDETEIHEIRTRHAENSKMSLENQIVRYGIEEGTKRYETWLSTTRIRSHRTTEFWISRGYSEDEAKQAISELQDTSSLKKFIDRYGEDCGLEKYLELNVRKTKHLSIAKSSVSKLETQFFEELSRLTPVDLDKGRTCKLIFDNKLYYCDYLDSHRNKVIEINGYFWHMKPGKYVETDINTVNKKSAKEIWEYDKIKLDNIRKKGFDVLVLWEDDINEDRHNQLMAAKKFLEEENENKID